MWSTEQITAGSITACLITAVLIVFVSFVPPVHAQVTFTDYTVDNSFGGPGGVYACDIDGDDDNDILGAAVSDNEIAWWRSDGGNPIQWTAQTIEGNFTGARSVYARDGDEDNDMLGATLLSNEIKWWKNETTVGISDQETKRTPYPSVRQLSQNYPNPFNPATTIQFALQVPSQTRLSIYDLHGKFVKELIRDHLDAGLHSIRWDGTDRRGRTVGSGIYFYKLTAGDLTEMKRMIILK